MSNRAWVTLATNDSYGLGALVLANSLRRASSAYPAVVLITPSVSDAMRERLGAVFAEVITVDVLDSRDATHLALLQRPELGITFTKIHCWSLTQYDKCVFLDADTLIVQNCDELFEREEFSAAPDVGWPDCFNSGVFVYVPSADTYSRLITFAQERGSFDGGDQGLLNAFFSDWAHGDINKHLPFLYNVTSAAFYSYLPALKHYGQNLKIIHFIGAAKPWLQQFNWESRSVDAPEHLRELLQLWWDLFVAQVHTSLDATMGTTVEVAVEDAPPQLPPQDVLQHYAPTLDPESEFQWHHPEAQIPNMENQPQSIDTSHYHDPWEYYRGNIPPIINTPAHSNVGGNKEFEEIMKYLEYRPPYQEAQHKQSPWEEHKKSERIYQNEYQHQPNHHQHEQPHQQQHTHLVHAQHHREEHFHHEHYSDNHAWHQEHHSPSDHSQHYKQNNYQHEHHDPSLYEHGENKNESHPQHSYYDHQHHHDSQYHNQSRGDSNIQHKEPHKNFENHSECHHEREDYNKHGHIHHVTHSVADDPAQKSNNHWSNHIHNEYNHLGSLTKHRNRVNIYRVDMDVKRRHVRNRKSDRKIPDEMMNGDATDSESEDELIIPRHPYDGFYLRHRSTIDSRGRKICTHEVPPTPSPPPSPPPVSPSPLGSLSPAYSEEYLSASECEGQTGVAGNLARVVASGSGYQREAIDELTRRQGWEAGNIDYMGADSFDNIWAKISQTLNQSRTSPPKQPSPPRKEPSPPKESEVATPAAASAPEVPVPEVPVPEVPAPSAPAATEEPAPVAAPVTEAAVKESKVPVETAPPVTEVPKPEAVPTLAKTPAPAAIHVPKTVEEALAAESAAVDVPKKEANKTEPSATPKSTPKASTPVTEVPPIVEAVAAAPKVAKPAAAAVSEPATPEKSQEAFKATDSPPLANTPSKDEAPSVPAAKSEERRKRAGKLQLSPPAAADAIPTPDSELEDAASLAQSIIASELSTTLTSPSPSADVTSPPPPVEQTRLTVEEPQVPTPPVSLAQIGVKPKGKPSTAAQIESSVSDKTEVAPASPTTPTTPSEPGTPTEVPKKKVVKKAAKGGSTGDAPTPVPPPRKKEKKPKEK